MAISVYTIGGGDLLVYVFNAVAMLFTENGGIRVITNLAILFGGLTAAMKFSQTKDVRLLLHWLFLYVMVTALLLVPKTTVIIEDQTGRDLKPRIVDHVPLSLAIVANITTRLGIGITQMMEQVFHFPNDLEYHKTGMMMGSKLVSASQHFQITDPLFAENLSEFMQQCVFYDLLLSKYTIKELLHAENPWDFIRARTSVARAFPLKDDHGSRIYICQKGAEVLDKTWQQVIQAAARTYGAQLFGKETRGHQALLSRLQGSYDYFTQVTMQGEDILRTNLLSNAVSNALSHTSAQANAPAALQLYEDTKSELQARHTMNQAGRQTAIWLPHFKNTIEAIMYAAFIFIYFFSYFPFGMMVLKNYVLGLFFLQSMAPIYAIVHFAASFYAQNRSLALIGASSDHGLSIANIQAVTQANADALAIAGYLMWPVTIGGALMIFRGLPAALQSFGQYVGGIVQHAGSHTASETVGGNISLGNLNYGNRSLHNMSANHWDSNARYFAGAATLQTQMGSSFTITPDGGEVLDNRGSVSNLGVSVQVADSVRSSASRQAQANWTTGMNQMHAAGAQYASGFRKMEDFATHQGHSVNSGVGYSVSESAGKSTSAQQLSQFLHSWAKDHNISHEKSAQIFGQVYAELKAGIGTKLFGAQASVSGGVSAQARTADGKTYNEALRYAQDHHLTELVDHAKREAKESHYRDGSESGNRFATSVTQSFDQGDHLRQEASSHFSKSESYAELASTSSEHAGTVQGNYTQEFYEWMRQKPVPSSMHGQGTWTPRAIDELAIRDVAALQGYANEFVAMKTQETMQSFEQRHHLQQGSAHVEKIAVKNHADIQSKSHLDHPEYGAELRQTMARNNVGAVSEIAKQQVDGAFGDYQKAIEDGKQVVKESGTKVQQKAQHKIEGGAIGSI